MKPIVVDSCIIVKWYIPEKYSEYAIVLRDDYLKGKVDVIAPVYAMIEFTNTLRKYVTRKLVAKEDAIKALKLLEATEIKYIDITIKRLEKALKYSVKKHVTLYDAYYITLAHEYNGIMYTADEKLLRKLENKEQKVKHIREYISNRKQHLKQ